MLSFHRSQTFEIKIQKPESPRAFVFDVAIGVTKPAPEVDPLSGMLLNLVDVDAVMSALHNFWSSQSWTSLQSLAEKSRDFVAAELAKKKTELSEIILHEKRGFWLGWRGGEWLMGREEMRELGGHLYRLQFESSFVEAQIENQAWQVWCFRR